MGMLFNHFRFINRSIFFIAWLCCATTGRAQSEWIVAADPWCPFNCTEADAIDSGYVIDALRLIAKANGRELNYRVMPWSRALLDLNVGKVDIAIGVMQEQSAPYLVTKKSWGRLQQSYVTLKGNSFAWDKMNGLRNKRVLLVKDYDYGSRLNHWASNHATQVEYVFGERTNTQALAMLVYRRADVFINSAESVNWYVQHHPSEHTFDVTPTGYRNDFHLAISAKRHEAEALRDALDNGLQKLRVSGELKTVLARYGLRDWE